MPLHPHWNNTDDEPYLLLRKKNNGSVVLTEPNKGFMVGLWVGFAAKFRARLWAWWHGYRTEEVNNG